MKATKIAVLLALCISTLAHAQEQEKPPEIYEIAQKEAERLEDLLDLQVWQVFKVDSTIQYNYQSMKDELEKFQKARVSNPSLYKEVQDKWLEATDSSYMTVFSKEQWNEYLKGGAGKERKARAKRKKKAEEATRELKARLEKIKGKRK